MHTKRERYSYLRSTRKSENLGYTLLIHRHERTVRVTHGESGHDRGIVHEQVVRVLDLERLVDNDTDGGGADPVVRVEVVVGVDVLLDGGRGGVRPEELHLRVGLGLRDDVLASLKLDGLVDGIHKPWCLDEGGDTGGVDTNATTGFHTLREVDSDGEELAGVVRLCGLNRDTGTRASGTLSVASPLVRSAVCTPEVDAWRSVCHNT
jgi:hypothetical protein